MPGGWRFIESGPGRDGDIDRAVDAAYASADRDSSAVAKHWMKAKLRSAFTAPDDVDSEVVAVAYPERTVAGMLLPVSATVIRLALTSDSQEDAMRMLALLSTEEPGATIVATELGVVLRSHTIRDLSGSLVAEVEQAPVDEAERAAIVEAVDKVPTLRARYVVPASDGGRWHAVAFTAMLGSDDEALANHYLELFDAFIQTLSRKDA
jgi:hypothetical protein